MRPRRLIEAKSPDVFIICSALLVCYVSLAVPIVATDGVCQSNRAGRLDTDPCLFVPESACNREGKAAEEMAGKLFACDFEVFGIVQGVFFRKYTQKQATSLGLKGWCMNTRDGTVKGQMEGEAKPVNEMKHWLQTKGSPTSRIDKAVFSEMKEISKYSFNDFSVKR
ncbi:AAEL008369-PB [Aedes aegypti]|uniref:Acylphosphatase n=2 Tax=Aedes aegypti TaxID=7159 RepID=Q16Z05_AEDAE|nr:AAEL008369-PB [Aedes aegypti]